MWRVIGCITQEHDLRLVALAACICALACGTTLNLLARAWNVRPGSSWAWLFAAAAVFGGGVWSLHFVAMLAFTPGVEIGYAIPTTIASILVAIGGAFASFVAWRFSRDRPAGILVGGILLGLAVSAMHYTGVAAMRIAGGLHLDAPTVLASIAFGVTFAVLGLSRGDRLTSICRRIEVSGWLGLGICGMHFIAMSAMTIEPGSAANQEGTVLGTGSLAVAVGSVSLAILVVGLAATLVEQHLTTRAVLELQRMRLLSDLTQEALIIIRNGIILQVNAACGRMFGKSTQSFVGCQALNLFSEGDRPSVTRRMREPREHHNLEEICAISPSGGAISVEFACSELTFEGKPATAIALRDLSDRKRNEEAMRHLAHHDALTDLANRFLLRERLANELTKAARSGETVALLYLDLDRFKPVNDLLGHAAGDALLVQLARRLEHEVRASDTVARIGGDEFVVLAVISRPDDASILAKRLIHAVSVPFDLGLKQMEIGTSIGIALYPADGDDDEVLMRAADTAMYRAKHEMRGTYRFYEAAMDDQVRVKGQLEQDLRHAIVRDELHVHYQPMVSCASGEVEGFEALLRWHHPERGMVPPATFIPLAEESGLIVEIGEWVLETACRTAAGWKEPKSVAVNVSPLQFRRPDLPAIVAAVLIRTGLPANRLELEVTEGIFLKAGGGLAAILSALRAAGVRLALDDFGTGYSSLSYLCSFKFDKLKIDRSFVKRLGEDQDATMIVRTIIGLAHNLGLSVVAEGVETPRQLGIIRDLNCDQAQGYLLGRPLPMDAPTQLTAARAKTLMFGSLAIGPSSESTDDTGNLDYATKPNGHG